MEININLVVLALSVFVKAQIIIFRKLKSYNLLKIHINR